MRAIVVGNPFTTLGVWEAVRLVLLLAALLATTIPPALAGSSPLPVQTHVVATGRAPCGTATGGGALWVATYETGKLLRIDPRSKRITRRFAVGPSACRVVVRGSSAWVTRDRASALVRVHLRTGRREAVELGGMPFDVLSAAAVWVTGYDTGTVTRINPATGKIERVFEIAGNPAGLTGCGGKVWVGHGKSATWLTSIEPAAGTLQRVDVGTIGPGWPRCVRGDVWVVAPGAVLKIDAETGKVLGKLRTGATPAEAAGAPDGLVWVTDKELARVLRIDPERVELVDSFSAGPGAFSLVRTGTAMWITSFAGSDIRRYAP